VNAPMSDSTESKIAGAPTIVGRTFGPTDKPLRSSRSGRRRMLSQEARRGSPLPIRTLTPVLRPVRNNVLSAAATKQG
jgi:hypothetical protein